MTGAITLIQRFGGALNLNVHFYLLVLDGAYRRDGERRDRRVLTGRLPCWHFQRRRKGSRA